MPKLLAKIPFNFFTLPITNEYGETAFYALIETGAGDFFVDNLEKVTDSDAWRTISTAPKWLSEGLKKMKEEVTEKAEVSATITEKPKNVEEYEDAGFE